MYTNAPIKLHHKCLCLLEMIQEAGNRVERAKGLLIEYDKAQPHWPVRLMYKRSKLAVDPMRWLLVQDRLVGYYQKLIIQLTTASDGKLTASGQ